MTRIKRTEISLRAIPAKLQTSLVSRHILMGGLLLAVMSGSLLIVGCVAILRGGTGTIAVDGFVLKQVEMENVRFDLQGLPFSIQHARAYSLTRGETIVPRWDTHEWHWESEGTMCDFTDNTSAGACQVCDFCNLPQSTSGPPCMGIHPTYGPDSLEVVVESGFITTANPRQVLSYVFRGGDVIAACSNSTQGSPSFFVPTTSGLYRLRSAEQMIFRGETEGEIKIHMVEPGGSQKVAYQLTGKHSETSDKTREYWTWTMEGNSLWLENFSPNLRVTDIRFFRGSCSDGSAQGRQCLIPNEASAVKPSRILFLPNFQATVSGHQLESSLRCYNDQGLNGNSFINLDHCRNRNDTPPNQRVMIATLPTYENASANPDPFQKLTWLVEFDIFEGADADLSEPGDQAMDPNAELIIEFTIQAN